VGARPCLEAWAFVFGLRANSVYVGKRLSSGRGLRPWPTIHPASRLTRQFSSSTRQRQPSVRQLQPPQHQQLNRVARPYAPSVHTFISSLSSAPATSRGHITPRWHPYPASETDVCALRGCRIDVVAFSFSVFQPVQCTAIFALSLLRASCPCMMYLPQTFYHQPSTTRRCARRFHHL